MGRSIKDGNGGRDAIVGGHVAAGKDALGPVSGDTSLPGFDVDALAVDQKLIQQLATLKFIELVQPVDRGGRNASAITLSS